MKRFLPSRLPQQRVRIQSPKLSSRFGSTQKSYKSQWPNRPERFRITCLFLSGFYIILAIASGSVLFAFLEAVSAVFPWLCAPTNSPQRSELDWWPAGTTHALLAPDSPAQKRCSFNLYTKWKCRRCNVQFRKNYFFSSSFQRLWLNTAVLSQTPIKLLIPHVACCRLPPAVVLRQCAQDRHNPGPKMVQQEH